MNAANSPHHRKPKPLVNKWLQLDEIITDSFTNLYAASDSIADIAFGAERPSLAVAFEEFSVVGMKGDRVLVPSRLPVQGIRLGSDADPDSAFRS